jgi:hypothetical protein
MRTIFCRQSVFFRTGFVFILFAGIWGAMPVHAEPSAFSLISPEDGKSVLTNVLLDWEDSTDPDGEVTYTVLLSKGSSSFGDSEDIFIRRIPNSYRVLDNGILEDSSLYYWKVRAANKYGEISETEVRYFTTNNGNPVSAFIGGHVYTGNSKPLINIDIIISKIWNKVFSLKTDLTGLFFAELVPDNPMNPGTEETVMIEVGAKGCKPKSLESTIIIGESREVNIVLDFDGLGDVNGDLCLDLKDAISLLQILTAQTTSDTVSTDAALAPEPDKKTLGSVELIYVLQGIAEPSLCSLNSASE